MEVSVTQSVSLLACVRALAKPKVSVTYIETLFQSFCLCRSIGAKHKFSTVAALNIEVECNAYCLFSLS
jgi:hypothetical protein